MQPPITKDEWIAAYTAHLIGKEGTGGRSAQLLARETAKAHERIRGTADTSQWPAPDAEFTFSTRDYDEDPIEPRKP